MNSNLVYLLVGLVIGIVAGFGAFWAYDRANPSPAATDTAADATWHPKNLQTDLPPGEPGARIRYGYELLTKTYEHIGPLARDANMRYAGNNLSCNNCHLDGGRKIGSGSFVGVTRRFPQFRGRENKMGSLEERINGCMERSMNGRVMPEDSEEMQAMIAYMEWLSEGVPEDMEQLYKGYVPIEIPSGKADPVLGETLYAELCYLCHQNEGQGLKIPGSGFSGYIYPPLAGPDSYNHGAGMTRVLTAAQFIKGNMPFGATYDRPLVTDEQAYHIAAYINSLDRPLKSNTEADFPDKKLKPVSTPYGPWADDFTPEQHKYGPFPPIIAYYEDTYGITKTK